MTKEGDGTRSKEEGREGERKWLFSSARGSNLATGSQFSAGIPGTVPSPAANLSALAHSGVS